MRLWGCILEFVSRGSFIWSLFWDHSHLLWGYVGPYFNFHSFFGSLLGIIPKKCPYLTFSFWYLNAIKQWTAVLNKQSPDEKVNNAFVPFANSIATRSCTSNGLLIVRRTIKKVYKRYKIEKNRELTSHYWLYDAHYWPEKSSSNRFCYIWRYTALDMVDGAHNCRENRWFLIWKVCNWFVSAARTTKKGAHIFFVVEFSNKSHYRCTSFTSTTLLW